MSRTKKVVPVTAALPVPYYAFPQPPDGHPEQEPVSTARTLKDKNAVVANVTITKPGKDYYAPAEYQVKASGSAKREQGDRYDPVTGELLALARAYENLARQLRSEGDKRVAKMVKDMTAERERLEAQRNAPKRPVKRRTKAEWDALQTRRELDEVFGHLAEQGQETGGFSLKSIEYREGGAYAPVQQITGDFAPVQQITGDFAPVQLTDGRCLVFGKEFVTLLDSEGRVTAKLARA